MNRMRQFVTMFLLIGVLGLCTTKANAGMEEIKRLLVLIDTIGKTDCDVQYNGRIFNCQFVARFARVFLATHYRGETAEEWVDKWCYRGTDGSLVWVSENQKYKIASKRLKEELKKPI